MNGKFGVCARCDGKFIQPFGKTRRPVDIVGIEKKRGIFFREAFAAHKRLASRVIEAKQIQIIRLQQPDGRSCRIAHTDRYAFALGFFREVALFTKTDPERDEGILLTENKSAGDAVGRWGSKVEALAKFFRVLQFADFYAVKAGQVVCLQRTNVHAKRITIGEQFEINRQFFVINDTFATFVVIFSGHQYLLPKEQRHQKCPQCGDK